MFTRTRSDVSPWELWEVYGIPVVEMSHLVRIEGDRFLAAIHAPRVMRPSSPNR